MEMAWSQPTDSVALAAEALDVWAVRLDHRAAPWETLVAALSAAERQRADQFRLEQPRQRFIVTRAALRALLGNYLGLPPKSVPLEIEPAGKPRLGEACRASGMHFSIAHSGDLALIAATTGCEVGVDVERVRAVRHAEHIARRFFHPAETEAILAAGPAARDAVFMQCWTGKEAVLKAIGNGITGSLASFCVPADKFDATWITLPAMLCANHSRCWLQQVVPCEGYVGAVACLGEERHVRRFAFDF
jgi:4'-phosphopantetheinyl transferase